MGISGLLPLLKSIHKPCSLKKYSGQTLGVDAYGWLHRGTVACAIDLALDKPTTKYIDFVMSRVRMLVHFGITPYLVFDGDYLPSKAGTEKERSSRRKESKRVGLELLKLGKTSQAHLELQKAVDVTPKMARLLIEELKYHNIPYVVAPYEADPQMIYLERKGLINGIISEDSDLLVFGAKCLITKLDKYGECVEINRNTFTACREISLVGWTDVEFRRMAILSGCDYLPSIGKMGLKTAYRLLRKHKTVERVVKAAQFDGQFKVPQGYLESFRQAENTFLYQWVFCPLSDQLVNLTQPENGVDVSDMPFIGRHVPSPVAIGVSSGDLDPHTKEPIVIENKERRHSKPMRTALRSISTVQTPDPKQKKPIDSFFKPRRIPLAELDPNMFAASSSQQNLLQQSNRGWTAALVPPAQQRPVSTSRIGPQLSRRAISDSSTGNRSIPPPSKRQRLCSESNLSPSQKYTKVETGVSRFFPSQTSPSLSTRSLKEKKKETEKFDIWSDDSLEEAVADLPEPQNISASVKPRKRIPVFKDSTSSSFGTDSQSTTRSKVTEPSQESLGTTTPATSQGSPEPDLEEDEISTHSPKASLKDIRAKFTFEPTSNMTTRSPLATIQLKVRSKTSLARTISAPASTTILRSNVADTTELNTSKTFSTQTDLLDEDVSTSKEDPDIEDSAWAAMEAGVVIPASDDEHFDDSGIGMTPQPAIKVKGSEDLLVSESECEGHSSPNGKPTLNLGRFAFTS